MTRRLASFGRQQWQEDPINIADAPRSGRPYKLSTTDQRCMVRTLAQSENSTVQKSHKEAWQRQLHFAANLKSIQAADGFTRACGASGRLHHRTIEQCSVKLHKLASVPTSELPRVMQLVHKTLSAHLLLRCACHVDEEAVSRDLMSLHLHVWQPDHRR